MLRIGINKVLTEVSADFKGGKVKSLRLAIVKWLAPIKPPVTYDVKQQFQAALATYYWNKPDPARQVEKESDDK